MTSRSRAGETLDYDGLAEFFSVLSNPNRLRILRQLLSPRTVSEIELKPLQAAGAGGTERPVSRQGVRQHVERLQEMGALHVREGRRASGPVQEFLVNHARLFALAEEVRKLGALRPVEAWASDTLPGGASGGPPAATGPRLLIVHGLNEGTAFPLLGTHAEWSVGRSLECGVPLDFDPFVSSRHCRIVRTGRRFEVVDEPTSRNGTSLNWRRLEPGGRAPLVEGDVIGVGRSLLLFRT